MQALSASQKASDTVSYARSSRGQLIGALPPDWIYWERHPVDELAFFLG
jgi:hypothetical protein